MIKKYKNKIIATSIVLLMPMLFGLLNWNRISPDTPTHWGPDGIADGFGGRAFIVFGLPLITLALDWLSLFFVLKDQEKKKQNSKALTIMFWIVPIVSIGIYITIYYQVFNQSFSMVAGMSLLLGVLFTVFGNFMPKVKQNPTFGIKIYWTLHNEENWNKTHRFAGKLWVVAGLLMILAAFLPADFTVSFNVCTVLILIFAPMIYSYSIYRKDRKKGIVYAGKSNSEKIWSWISSAVGIVVAVIVAVVLFTGNVNVECGPQSMNLDASFWKGTTVEYSDIETIEYQDDLQVGTRDNGIGSMRLAVGTFHNQEFGSYTLYSYTNAPEYLVLKDHDGETLVIGLKDQAQMKEIYDTVKAHLEA